MTDIEILPSLDSFGLDQSEKDQLETYIDQMVQRRVAELMAHRSQASTAIYQPFFESVEVKRSILKLQKAPERNKWSVFFAMHGCLACGRKDVPYGSTGMCNHCHSLTYERLRKINHKLNKQREQAEEIIEQHYEAYRADKQTEKRPTGRPKTHPKILKGDPSARIRKLREFAGLSQDELAKLAGVHRETVLNLERGHHVPHSEHCRAIKKVLAEALIRALWPE